MGSIYGNFAYKDVPCTKFLRSYVNILRQSPLLPRPVITENLSTSSITIEDVVVVFVQNLVDAEIDLNDKLQYIQITSLLQGKNHFVSYIIRD